MSTKPAPLAVALAMCTALKQAGVHFVHWKSNDHLAEALAGLTDIDIYVDPNDRAAFERVMASLDAAEVNSQVWGTYPGIGDWLVLDDATGRFLHLHLHYALMTGLKRVKHLRLPWDATLMTNLRDDPSSGWPIPKAEMELLILLVRIWAKMPPWRRWFGNKIPSHILRELNWLRADASPAELSHLVAELFPRADAARVLPVLDDAPLAPAAIIAIAKLLNDELRQNVRMSWPAALVMAFGRNSHMAAAKVLRKLMPDIRTGKTLARPGIMIALVGSDGAGKSTLGRDLHKWLRFKLDVHSYYMGSGDGGTHVLDWLRRGIRALVKLFKGAKAKKPRNSDGMKPDKPRSFFGKTAELYQLVIMRHKIRLLRAARQLTAGGSMVLTDRYPQTQVIGISDGPKIQDGRSFDWAARKEMTYYDQARELGPDIVIKLKISPQIAHARKPDHDFDAIARKCQIVDGLEFPQCAVAVIDAEQSYPDVLLAAKRAIWAHLKRQPA
jgi:thymidylate kinase